jgi:hypothetical protein
VRRPTTASLSRGLLLCAATALLAGCGRENRTALQQGGLNEAEVGVAGAVVLFVLVPAVLLIGIAALVWLPGMVRGARYRPGRGWSAPPVWFAGPPDPAAAVEEAQPGDVVRGGASGSW